MSKSIAIISESARNFEFGYNEEHPKFIEFAEKLRTTIFKLIKEEDYRKFYINFDVGVPMIFAEMLVFDANFYENLEVTIIAPYKGFEGTYNTDWKARTEHLLGCNNVIYSSEVWQKDFHSKAIEKAVASSTSILAFTDMNIDSEITKTLKKSFDENKTVVVFNMFTFNIEKIQ